MAGRPERVNGASRCYHPSATGRCDPSVTEQLKTELERSIAEVRETAGASFAKRATAIDLLEVHVIDRLQPLDEHGEPAPALRALHSDALELQQQLEAANERFLNRLRVRIRAGRYTPAGLERALARRAGNSKRDRDYDTLDLLVAGLLEAGTLEDERAEREPEMVAYQPTPGRIILQLLARADIQRDDVLFDLGSGLGWVVILVALLRETRAVGIEYEPAFVDYARSCARALNMSRAKFVHADAREASLTDGTVFFLYTPFRGQMLQQVLERLRVEAEARAIRVCTYGPCTAEVARVGWLGLRAGDPSREDEVVVFQSV